MNYKFAIVLETPNDYLRRADLSYMNFLNPTELKLQFENDIIYTEEDVNARRADKIVELLKEHNIAAHHINAVKWKNFPKLQQTS